MNTYLCYDLRGGVVEVTCETAKEAAEEAASLWGRATAAGVVVRLFFIGTEDMALSTADFITR